MLALQKVQGHGDDLFLRAGRERLEVDGRLLDQCLLQMRHYRARRRSQQSECRFGLNGELDIAETQRLRFLLDHRLAPEMNEGFAAKPEQAFFLLGSYQQ